MRRLLLSFALVCLGALSMYAAKEDLYLLHEGFENGVIPQEWSQEYISGQQSWSVETGDADSYPSGATGTYRAVLRNQTNQTQSYVTRLISPVINLKDVYQPILVFSRGQMQRTGDVDELRVYYRTSSDARWVLIGEYIDKTNGWKNDTIALTAASETYQLAFEVADKLGRGVVLDEIIVRPMPTCDNPSNITIDGLTVNSATLRWNASLDADSFHIVLSKSAIASEDLANPSDVVVDEFVTDFKYETGTILQQNVTYYGYIISYCGLETSEWTSFTFTTRNQVNIPYIQTFDKNYASGTLSHVAYWTHGTSIRNSSDGVSMEFMPFVNQNTSESSWKNYSFSSTTCLVFTGARNLTTDIPAGSYVYAATPEINIDDIKKVQVTFWGTCYTQFDEANANGLIVGVMTNPSDFNTFVPVDTVYSKESRGFARYTIYFDNYQGDGKYIAFASNFTDKPNSFFMDDVEITELPALKEITNISLSNISSKAMTINADLNGNTAMRLVVQKDSIDKKTGKFFLDPDILPAEYRLIDTIIENPTMPMKVDLAPSMRGKFLQIFLQPVKGEQKGAISLPTVALIPTLWDGNEHTITFDETEKWAVSRTTNFGYVSATISYPYTITTTPVNYGSTVPAWPSSLSGTDYAYSGTYSVYIGKEQQEWSDGSIKYYQQYGDYIALPEVEDLSNFMIKFFLRGYSASYDNMSRVAVGVMTDPFDPSTFEPIAYCESPGRRVWVPCVVSFTNYKGNGHFPAIMADVAPTKYLYSTTSGSGGSYTTNKLSYQYVDDITLSSMGDCIMPTDLAAAQTDTTVTITWNGNGMTKFAVNIFKDEAMKEVVMTKVVENATSAKCEGLDPHTLYYYNVETICEGNKMPSILGNFKTECAVDGEAIPYIENFESYGGGVSSMDLPNCWTTIQQKYVSGGSGSAPVQTNFYPYIYLTAGNAHTGTKSFYFYYSNATSATPVMANKPTYAALPMMNEDLTKLQMTFWMKAGGTAYVGDTVFIGAMTDPTDLSTFDTIAITKTAAAIYTEYIVSFDKYKGQGKYIAFMKSARELGRGLYIDDIVVDYLADCEKIQGVTANNAYETGATITWQEQNATQWEIIVLSDTTGVTLSSVIDPAMKNLVENAVTDKMPYVITKCPETNKPYYVAVRAICDATNKGAWSNIISFKTTCVAKTTDGYGLIDFAADNYNTNEFVCWTVGKREGTTADPSITAGSHLQIFNSTASDGAYAIMPPIAIDSINRLQIKLTASGGTGAAYLRELTVGVITNPSDLSTFTAVEVVKLPKATTSISKTNHAKNLEEAETFIVRFDNYHGDYEGEYGKQIMFLSENNGVANYIYLYSMQIDTIPSCLEPLHINDVEINTYDATIGWDTIGTNYQVQLLNDKDEVIVDSLTNKQQMKFEGLAMLSNYSVQVRTICEDGGKSAWSPIHKFATECPVSFPLPYSENFDDYAAPSSVPYEEPNCWTAWYGGVDATTSSTYARLYASAKRGTTGNGYYLASTTGNASTAPKEAVAVLPALEGLNQALLHFYAKATTTTGTRAIKVGITEQQDDLDSVMAHLTIIDSVETINSNWEYYTFDLSSYQGTGKHIVLICYGGNTSATALSTSALYTYLDDIYVEKAPTCFRPINNAFASATASSITLTWTPQGKETAWDIAYLGKDGELTDQTPYVTITGEPKGTVNGLTDATEYDFYVRANCGEGETSEWSDVASGKTLCKVALEDAAWNFDDPSTQYQSPLTTTTTYKLENCWTVGNVGTGTYSYVPYNKKNTYSTTSGMEGSVTSKYAYSDSCALNFYNTSSAKFTYAILPEVLADLDELQISFKGRSVYESYGTTVAQAGQFLKYYNTYSTGTYGHSLKIGTMTDPYDPSTFEELINYQFTEVTNENCSTKVEGDYWEDVTVSLYKAKGKFIALVADYPGNNYVWVDNVKVEKETGLNMPTCLTVPEDKLGGYSAEITWNSRATKFNIVVKDADNKEILNKVINESTCAITDLTPTVTYTVEVSSLSEDGLTSSKPAKTTFTTPCVPYTKETAHWDFMDASYAYTGNTSYLISPCWEAGQAVKSSATTYTYTPQAKVNTATYQYSRGAYDASAKVHDRAMQLYNYSTTYANSYIVLPELNVDMDSTALHFWMRAAYFYTATYSSTASRNRLYTANNNYNKELVIGVMTDETDFSTFEAIDKVTYPYSWSATTNIFTYNDESGNDYWTEVILPLKKYKDKGRIVLLYEGNSKTSYMYIDDVEIIDASFCTAPTGVHGDNIGSNSADIKWSVAGKDSVILQVSTTEEFEETSLLVNDTLVNQDGKYELKGLNFGSTYYARMMHLCGEEEVSDWSATSSFCTLYDIRFYEDFTEVRTCPVNWTRCTSDVDDVLYSGITPAPITTETAVSWTRTSGLSDIAVSTGTDNGTSTSVTKYKYWLVSPVITLKDVTKEEKVMLSFKLHLTNADNKIPFNTPAEDDQFIVAVSTDGGVTFRRADAIFWKMNPESGDIDYNSITGIPTTQMIDMTKYIGNDIKVAFVQNSLSAEGKPCSKNRIHLDDIQINRYVKNDYEQNICEWNDYADDNFQIDAYDVILGTTKYQKFVPARKKGTNDVLTTMLLTVNGSTINNMNATICEGEDYLIDNFDIRDAKASGIFKQKLSGINTCDSIVVLNMTVLPRLYSTIADTICQGTYYDFNGVKYYSNTIKTDTLVASTGCDSISTLYLTVNEILQGDVNIHLCPGDVYHSETLGDITVAGDYIDSVRTASGCDSIAHLHIFTHDSVHTYIRAAICQGDKYSQGSFEGLINAGDYTLENKTIYGCDSLVTLHLLVADPETMKIRDQIDASQLPYVLNGEELLPIGTADGAYTQTIMLPCGQATITIIVGEDDGAALENINGKSANIRKVVVDDKVFIIVNDTWYDVLGNKVEAQR